MKATSHEGPTHSPAEFDFTFEMDAEGWTVGFPDLPAGHDQSIFELEEGHRPLRARSQPQRRSLHISKATGWI